jgi:putative SOS response-associated peptidase YedK
MCGNFSALKERRLQKKLLEQGLDIDDAVAQTLEDLDQRQLSLFPSCRSWILDRDMTLRSASWGLVPGWSQDPKIARYTFNARSESLREKPAFRDAFQQGRCLVPVEGWWEWDAHKRKTNVRRPEGSQLWFAGFEHADTFTVVTRSALPVLEHLHARQPVLLDARRALLWLDHPQGVSLLENLLQEPYCPELELVMEPTKKPLQLGLGL